MVSLSKELMFVAGEALRTNIATVGPLVLPLSEQLWFLAAVLLCRLRAYVKPYVPDFKLTLEPFCIHDGGRGVLDELERSLVLSAWHMEPSRMTLSIASEHDYADGDSAQCQNLEAGLREFYGS